MRLSSAARLRAPLCLMILGVALFAGCSSDEPAAGTASKIYSYTPPATPGGRLCVAQCGDAKEFCQQDCSLDYRRCVEEVQAQAMIDYDKYTREQFAAHQPIELRPHDFERNASCDEAKKSCFDKCDNPYQKCYQSCGGAVGVTSSCQYLCF